MLTRSLSFRHVHAGPGRYARSLRQAARVLTFRRIIISIVADRSTIILDPKLVGDELIRAASDVRVLRERATNVSADDASAAGASVRSRALRKRWLTRGQAQRIIGPITIGSP